MTRATWPIAVVLLAACGPRAPNATDSQPSPPTPGAAVTQSAAPAAAPSSLSPQPPFDIPPQAKQAQVVTYAWQQFVALNWPAASGPARRARHDEDDRPGRRRRLAHVEDAGRNLLSGRPGATALEPVRRTTSAAVRVGAARPARASSCSGPRRCPATSTTRRSSEAKEAVGGTLTDQHGNLAHFEVRHEPDDLRRHRRRDSSTTFRARTRRP